MYKKELSQAFSGLHAPDALVRQVLAPEKPQKRPARVWQIARRVAVCAAVLAVLLGSLLFWPGETKTEDGRIIAAPGVLRVYACDVEKISAEELYKYELTDGIGGYGSYIPFSNLTRGIPLSFQFPEEYFEENEITFSVSVDYGYLFSMDNDRLDEKNAALKNGDKIWWTSAALSDVDEVVDKNGRFYGYVIIYAQDDIVGYGIIDFYYYQPESEVPPVFSAIGFSTVCFPLVDGEYQNVELEYVWGQIEEYKQMKSEEKVVIPMA